MRRIDERTVELTDTEIDARTHFEHLLDLGWGIPRAARVALNTMRDRASDEFIEYLSDNTCRRWGQRVLIKREYRDKP